MCDAPEEYVRVYLYGLCLAYTGEQPDMVELEEQLHQTAEKIEAAMKYWQIKGFVSERKTARGTLYEFLAAQQDEAAKKPGKNAALYEYRGYNEMLGTLLKRALSASDLKCIYDFTDIYGLPQDVVIAMIEHCVASKGPTVNVSYIERVAQTWAEEGIDTREKALLRAEEYKALSSGVRIVMKQMGLIGKSPGKTELDYFRKWAEQWGFTQESIVYAMRGLEFAKDQPFRYLDAVLRNLYENGAISSRKINEYNTAYQDRRARLKEVLAALDYSRLSVQPRHERLYAEWAAEGVPHSIILLACEHTAKNGSRKLEVVGTLLKEWKNQGITTEDDARKYIRRQDTLEKRVKQVYDHAGIKKQIAETDILFYENCLKRDKMKHDVLMCAAEIASVGYEPAALLRKVLKDWRQAGVTTLQEATAQELGRYAKDMKNSKKDFEQRQYSKEDMEKRTLDIIKDMEQDDEK